MDEQTSQVAVALLRDAAQARSTARAVLTRHQPHPDSAPEKSTFARRLKPRRRERLVPQAARS